MNEQVWIHNQGQEFADGFDSYCACEGFDRGASSDWQAGWLYAAEKLEA